MESWFGSWRFGVCIRHCKEGWFEPKVAESMERSNVGCRGNFFDIVSKVKMVILFHNGEKNETDDFKEGDLKRLFDGEYLPVTNEHALNDEHSYTEQEEHEFQENNDLLNDSTDILNQENQIIAVPETFESICK